MFKIYFFNFIIGTCLASHACLIFDRYYSENTIFSRSHCNNCGYALSLIDEIPIFSFLYLKGKCRYCQNLIPVELLFFEYLGGFAFIQLNFLSFADLPKIIFIFSFLLITIFDYHDGEFPTTLLLPLFISCLFLDSKFSSLDILQFIPIFLLLLLFTAKKQLGTGDLLIYLFLCYYRSPVVANLIFLIASFLAIAKNIFTSPAGKYFSFHFIPYIFFAFILVNIK